MGTRADFYVGRGEAAEWLGSTAWDGDPGGVFEDAQLPEIVSMPHWRRWVAEYLASRDDATLPAHGWPWPWETSATTDYAYAWDGDEDGGQIYGSCFGRPWFTVSAYMDADEEGDDDAEGYRETGPRAVFPVMRTDKHAPAGTQRSGAMVIGF